MAVIAQEQRFWGLQKWERELQPGTVEPLSAVHMRTMSGFTIGESLHVVSPDEVAIGYSGVFMNSARRKIRTEINLDRFPSFGGFLVGRRTHYTWRSSSLPTSSPR